LPHELGGTDRHAGGIVAAECGLAVGRVSAFLPDKPLQNLTAFLRSAEGGSVS
jgi:hypothetical protein